ncbi:hypothetical protein DFH29DRAFT_1067858 [Suillus ampliporus]|nr:hypothetical protein DFH29DRAFT_1067858 [Suillus ampliporus]
MGWISRWSDIPATPLVFFADVSAIVRVDGFQSKSQVLCTFLHNHNIPRSVAAVRQGVVVESSLGPVRVPTVDGWYLSRQPFQATYLRGCNSVRPAVFDGRLLSPSIDAAAILAVGHEWFSHPNGSSNVHASQVQDDSFATQVLDLYLSVVK